MPGACVGIHTGFRAPLLLAAPLLLGLACSDSGSSSSTDGAPPTATTKGVTTATTKGATTAASNTSGGSGANTSNDTANTTRTSSGSASSSGGGASGPTATSTDSSSSGATTGAGGATTGAGGATTGTGGATTTGATNSTSGGPVPGDGGVTVDGPEILVGGEPLQLRGVNWNPVPKGGTHPGDLAYADFAAEDIALMQAAGINAVRTYEPLTDIGVLDAMADAGIFVVNTVFPYGGNPASSVDAPVNAVKDHPAILMWAIGNEWNYNGLYVDLSLDASIELINEVIGRIRDLDAAHPIATIYGELPDAAVLDRLSGIDVWGLNVYSGRSFGDRFTEWASRSNKPMFFGEYGADAWNATTGQYDPESQATATLELTQEILDHSILAGGVCSGGTLFEFADEWWKDQTGSANNQDVGGIAPGGGPFPDSTFNEEYWGIVSIDRVPRPAYDVLKQLYTE